MLTLEEKIGQMLLVGFDGLTAPDYILEWLAEGRISGVILFSRNVASPQQLADLTYACHAAAQSPILIGIDQEGGYVARLREGFTESPGAMALAAAKNGAEYAESVSRVLATEMRAVGINWTFAPVLDLSYNADNPTVGTRSFGSDVAHVSKLATASILGFQSGGVAACAKHFPGLGNTALDTHYSLPTLDTPLDHLLTHDLAPYQQAIDAGVASVMTTHTIYSVLDSQHPATLSPAVAQKLLRGQLAFPGVITSDCMEMQAITNHYGTGEAAVLAALAGVDLILVSHTRARQEASYNALLEAATSGRLPLEAIDAAYERINLMKGRFAITDAPNMDAIRAARHLNTVESAARAGTVLLKPNSDVLPLPQDQRVVLVEFASHLETGVVDEGGMTGLGAALNAKRPEVEHIALKTVDTSAEALSRAQQLAADADLLILATRNAHLFEAQLQMARDLIGRAKQVLHVCLRNPYDVPALPGAQAVICTCGDAEPSLQAAVDALLGAFTPEGTLPVSLENAP